LHAADKKCLYANDLLHEVENAKHDVQARLTSLPNVSGNGHDKKLRLEVQELVDEATARVRLLERRVEDLERESRMIPPASLPLPARMPLPAPSRAARVPAFLTAAFAAPAAAGLTSASEKVVSLRQVREPAPLPPPSQVGDPRWTTRRALLSCCLLPPPNPPGRSRRVVVPPPARRPCCPCPSLAPLP